MSPLGSGHLEGADAGLRSWRTPAPMSAPLVTPEAFDPIAAAWKMAVVFLLVGINGFFVAAEFSLVSIRQTRVEQLVAEGNRLAKLILRAKADPNRYLSASQIGITLASLALGWVAEPTVASLIMWAFHALHLAVSEALLHTVATGLTFGFITYMHIVMGEFIPKGLALNVTERTILACVLPLELTALAFTPFITVLNSTGAWFLKRMGIESLPEHHLVYSEDEIKRIVNASHEGGVLEVHEQEMLHKVFAFSDKVAREVMVPRPDMYCLRLDMRFDEVLQAVNAEGHTRYPVFDEDIDHIVGIFHAKDLIKVMAEGPEGFELKQHLRDVPFVPESKAVDDLLSEFKKGKTQVAIVMDEFGGTAGLVTLEDLLEEIVGDIVDEFDEESPEVEALAPDAYLVDGLYRIADANERFALDLPTDDFDTMGGWVFGQLGREPQVGDHATFGRVLLTVHSMDGHRITRLHLQLAPEGSEAEAPEEAAAPMAGEAT